MIQTKKCKQGAVRRGAWGVRKMKGRMGEEENGRAGRHQGVTVLPHGTVQMGGKALQEFRAVKGSHDRGLM